MAISIDWPTKVISIAKADMILIQSTPVEIYQLNMDAFHLILRDLEDDVDGMVFDTTHKYVDPVSVGGVTLARVVEIINGYTVTFEDAQYRVNLTGANTNLADVTNVNQVSVSSSNSAGLQDLSLLLSAAYQGEVCVDTGSRGQAGVVVPIGTRSTPVNNFADAKTIAEQEGIHVIRCLNTTTIASVDFSDGFEFTSDSPVKQAITIDTTANVTNCTFYNMNIAGVLDGNNVYRECVLQDVTYTSGFVYKCSFNGKITLNPNTLLGALDCFGNTLAGRPPPEIDMGGSGELLLRNYSGTLRLLNHTETNLDGDACIDLNSAAIFFDPTIVAGDFPVRGVGLVFDNSTGTASVRDLTVNQGVEDNAAALGVINTGVQKASKLIPHSTDI